MIFKLLRRSIRESLILCLAALLPAVAAAAFHPNHPGWRSPPPIEGEITLEEVAQLPTAVLWVDARVRSAYDQEHVPGAVLLNEDEWDRLMFEFLSRWNPGQAVVVYCDSQECHASRQVAQRLRDSGIAPVYVLYGGWNAWKDAQLIPG